MASVRRGARVVPAETVVALVEAQQIRAHAQQEANAILANAHAEMNKLREEAYREGLQRAKEKANALIIQASIERERELASLQNDIVTLAIDVARKIINAQLDDHPAQHVAMCAEVLRKVRLARSVILRVHPDDLSQVQGQQSALSTILVAQTGLQMVADADVDRGGCIVESDLGRIDARLSVQLAAIEKALAGNDD